MLYYDMLAHLESLPTIPQSPISLNYGSDLSCYDDIREDMVELGEDNIELVKQSVYRSLTTKTGSLIGDPDWGTDISALLSSSTDSGFQFQLEGLISSVFREEDRVTNHAVSVTVNGEDVYIDLTGKIGDAPFKAVYQLVPGGLKPAIGDSADVQ